jgi:hypothetical protein
MEFKVGDRVMAIGTVREVDRDGDCNVLFDGAEYVNTNMLAVELRPIPQNPIICDPNSPEAQALVGKEVYYGDFFKRLTERIKEGKSGVLSHIEATKNFPFLIAGCAWGLICAVSKKPTKKMTVSEATAMLTEKLGIQVEIVKEE